MNIKKVLFIFLIIPFTLLGKITEKDLRYVMPSATSFSVQYEKYPHWNAYREKEFIGICFITTDIDPTIKGYVGPIKILVGIYKNRIISGIKVISHSENIPLANKITEKKFQLQFRGKKIEDPFIIGKDINGISGATITVKAVVEAVKRTSRIMAEHFFPVEKKSGLRTQSKKDESFAVSYSVKKENPLPYIIIITISYTLLCISINLNLKERPLWFFLVLLIEIIVLIFILKFLQRYKKIEVAEAPVYYNAKYSTLKEKEILSHPIPSEKTIKNITKKREEVLILNPKWGIEKIDRKKIENQIESGNLSKKEAYNYKIVK